MPHVASLRRGCLLLAAAAGWLLASVTYAADEAPATVQDLDYGDVLFHFYQGDQFTALARLMAAEKLGRIEHHASDAELLRGGLYLSFGLHHEAAETFERLLTDSVATDTRDRAWYYLATIRAQRGYTNEALAAAERVGDELPDDLAAKKLMLHARLLMAAERPAEAVALLDGWKGPDDWREYARFNLGVALVSDGRIREGLKLLEKTGGKRKARTAEAQALKDRANLALGFSLLRDGEAEAAREPLQRVRLEGPFSNKALLGLGWADSALADYERALVPWQVLAQRDAIDPAVQESLLAVPHALAQLDAQSAAAQGYLDAVVAYEEEIARIDRLSEETRQGGLPDRLLAEDRSPVNGWFWRLDTLSASLESRYLADMLADDAFQEALQDYRDLRQAAANLARWRQALNAFSDMVSARQARFDVQLPAVDARLADGTLASLRERATELDAQVEQIASTNDLDAFATDEESARWQRVEKASARLERLGDSPPNAAMAAEKLRLYRGLLLWNANASFPDRLWQQRKALKQVQQALSDAEAQQASLAKARHENDADFVRFDAQIADAGLRIEQLHSRTRALLDDQEQRLVIMAVNELDARRERLEAYRTEAQFALATIYDRAAQASLGARP